MCGIAGLIGADGTSPGEATLAALARALAHRGPDGDGTRVRGPVGLAHTRLAIIDLKTGDQPLIDREGRALVANGEVYNHVELRAGLAERGIACATGSDCEPPLHLYAAEGAGAFTALRGMIALALDDAKSGRVVLHRDPFGIKPLYVAETAQGLAFASEAQALVAAGLVAPKISVRARNELLQVQFTTGRGTLFDGINRVMPGESLAIEGGQVVETHRRTILSPSPPRAVESEAAALVELDRVLEESVLMHQRADVPYGMFLSGGIDSSAVLALMARLNPEPVLAFTVGFPGAGVPDERDHARHLAESVGATHVDVPFTQQDFWALLPEVAAAMDDPAADYAVLPTYKLAREARRSVKVILSGEGGDELFGGYGRYRHAMRPWPFAKTMRRKGTFDGLGVLREELSGWREGIAESEQATAAQGWTKLQQAQAVDIATWLPNDLLTKLDRCLMAHGVEGRVPFLDPEVARFAFSLPDALKVRNGQGKYLLRKWLETHLPQAKPFSKKRGFTVPVAEWIQAEGARLGPLVARQEAIREIADPAAVAELFRAVGKREGFAAWTLLFYALWHRRHIEAALPEGDVFDCLS